MSPAVVALVRPGQVECLDEPASSVGADQVRIRTLLSGISAGTEMAFYRGTNPYLDKRWDPGTRLFVAGSAHSLEYPITGWGYEEVGEVVEVGTDVAGRGAGHACA
jgi:threonine dehydrogenase-like Zn-dependent dehydrogenase